MQGFDRRAEAPRAKKSAGRTREGATTIHATGGRVAARYRRTGHPRAHDGFTIGIQLEREASSNHRRPDGPRNIYESLHRVGLRDDCHDHAKIWVYREESDLTDHVRRSHPGAR